MDRSELYSSIAARKDTPHHLEPYRGGNGRIDRCVQVVSSDLDARGRRMLDVGGSIGDLCQALADRYPEERYCLDIAELPLRAAEAKGAVPLLADVDRDGIPLPDSQVQLVTALDFIEHIVDPEQFAREAFRVLSPTGLLIINTPNMMFWRHVQSLVAGRFPHTSGDREVYHGGHLGFFTFLDLHEILSAAGFERIRPRWFKEERQPPPGNFYQAVRMMGTKVDPVEFEFGDLVVVAAKP